MNPEVKQLWLDALRSGNYVQARGKLAWIDDDDESSRSYCCLGVLCELAARRGVCTASVNHNSGTVMYDRDVNLLPLAVMTWAGLSNSSVIVDVATEDGSRDSLAALNDRGASFPEIAKVIEEKL